MEWIEWSRLIARTLYIPLHRGTFACNIVPSPKQGN